MATLGLPLGFKRLNSFPIDSTAVFESFLDLSGYAADVNSVSYIGQICSVTGSDKAYIIKSDRTLQEIGAGAGGNFYPLDSNPSGYVASSQLSSYYLANNPSGYITGIENLVYTTGDQNISGVKNFYSIPTVSGIPLALSGQNSSAGAGAGELFTGNITVSIQAGKTFGQYKNGDVIPASGKTANEVIKLALFEALEPTVSLTSSSTIQFGATSASISLNFSKTINSQGASVAVNKIERKRAADSLWTTLTSDINATSPLSDSFNQTQYDTSLINYRYTVTDTANATKTVSLNITPTAYAAPTISSVNVGSVTRYKGDTATTYAGTITRNSPLIAITSYKLQRSINSGVDWTDVAGSSASVTGNPQTISVSLPETNAGDTNLKNTNTVQYRISVTDTYQTTNLTASTITFVHKRGIMYKSATTLTIADIDAASGLSLSNSIGGTYNNVTAGFGVYTFYVYNSALGSLAGVIQDGATPVLGAFTKISNLNGTNSNNSNVSYAVYVSNSDKAFTNNTLVFS
jgi:hypothetical protein